MSQPLEEVVSNTCPYACTPDDLTRLVDFDQRDSPALMEILTTHFGGISGVAKSLSVDLANGVVDDSETSDHASPTNRLHISNRVHPITAPSHLENNSVNYLNTTSKRREIFGRNYIEPPPPATILGLVWETIQEDAIIQILLFCAAIILIVGMIQDPSHGYIEGTAIMAAVVIVLSVASGNDYVKDQKFNKILLLSSDKKVKVWRHGCLVQCSSWDVVVGDIVGLAPGDEVPTDGLFLVASGLQLTNGPLTLSATEQSAANRITVDESPLTGETLPMEKSPRKPFMFAGCQVAEGTGFMLVTAVGNRSCAGRIQELLNEQQKSETTLQLKLKDLAVLIGYGGFAAGVCTFLGLLIRWLIEISQQKDPFDPSQLISIVNFLVTGVTIIVVAVPEGLPLAVTISLAFSVFKMIKDNVFVRHLNASETMGEADCICTDKTGTLTENRMTVVHALMAPCIGKHPPTITDHDHRTLTLINDGSIVGGALPNGSVTVIQSQKFISLLSRNIALNSSCFVRYEDNKLPVFVGSATEGALLVMTKRLGTSYEDDRKSGIPVPGGSIPFDSARKCMSSLYEFHEENDVTIGSENSNGQAVLRQPRMAGKGASMRYRLYTKGASEIVLNKCTHILSQPSKSAAALSADTLVSRPMEDEERRILLQCIELWASRGLRTLMLAFRDVENLPENLLPEDKQGSIPENAKSLLALESNLCFLTLVAIKDPLRLDVPDAVRQCQKAGLKVRMVTGDNLLTASFIARECGILTDGVAIEGPKFRALNVEEKKILIPKLQVLARSSPQDKFELVHLLRELGSVVSVTGDGTNDAPALKEADVGFAMGQSGTQIAMNASDIILLDDNFTSFVRSIAWGRNILDSVRKFLQFQLAVNIAAIFITFYGSVVIDTPILSPVQLLWVNMIMDTFGALGLASEEPGDDILDHPPHMRNGPLITPQMAEYVSFVAVFQATVMLLVLYVTPFVLPDVPNAVSVSAQQGDEAQKIAETNNRHIFTLVFTTFIFLQVFNEFTARQLGHELNIFRGLGRNRIFLLMITIIIVVQIIVVQFGDDFADTKSLTGTEWAYCILVAAVQVPCVLLYRMLIKYIRRYYRPYVHLQSSRSETSLSITQPKQKDTDKLSRRDSTVRSRRSSIRVMVTSSLMNDEQAMPQKLLLQQQQQMEPSVTESQVALAVATTHAGHIKLAAIQHYNATKEQEKAAETAQKESPTTGADEQYEQMLSPFSWASQLQPTSVREMVKLADQAPSESPVTKVTSLIQKQTTQSSVALALTDAVESPIVEQALIPSPSPASIEDKSTPSSGTALSVASTVRPSDPLIASTPPGSVDPMGAPTRTSAKRHHLVRMFSAPFVNNASVEDQSVSLSKNTRSVPSLNDNSASHTNENPHEVKQSFVLSLRHFRH